MLLTLFQPTFYSTFRFLLRDLFIPFDLYNDAAFKTLHYLKSRFIYNEIEAEVNLCFDQFMFKLAKNIFRHYKKLAAIQKLDSERKVAMQGSKSFWTQEGIQPNGYENVMAQRDIKLLGRSIDINKILSQMINEYMRHSLDTTITRFEGSDLLFVMELESLIETTRLSHLMLSKFLQLERFDDLLNEVNECIVPGENNGRILTHLVDECIGDIVPNFCFNNVTSR